MGTGVGEAMLIGAAVGATAGGAGAAIQGGDPLKGAMLGGAMGAAGGGLGAGFGATGGATAGGASGVTAGGAGSAVGSLSPTVTSLAAAPTAGTFGGLSAAPTAGTFGALSAAPTAGTFGALAAPTTGGIAGLSVPTGSALAGTGAAGVGGTGGAMVGNFTGYAPQLSNKALGVIGGTSLLGGMMGAERAQYGMPPNEEYDGPLSKLKYDPNKFTASTPTYAPDSVYTPQYRTYAAEGGIMSLAQGGLSVAGESSGYPMNKNPNPMPNLEVAYGMNAGGTPPSLSPQGMEGIMGVKKKGLDIQEMIDSAKLQGLTPAAYASIYGEGIKAEQRMARGGIADLGSYSDGGRMLKGPGDGMSDSIPGVIAGKQPARLADGEFVVPADVVSHLGNGSTDAGAKQLYAMMDKVRKARTGKKKQAPAVKANRYMPA